MNIVGPHYQALSQFYVKPTKDPVGVSSSRENQGTTRGKEKILWTSVGIEPTTSGLDLPLLCRLSRFVFIATRHNIHMYPYFLFAAIHHLNRPRLSLSDLVAQSAE